jgi:uracil-DNA glycosylase family 4
MTRGNADATSTLEAVTTAIVNCERCTRLRSYCRQVARDKKAAHRDDTYWGRPVPGFGDPRARILLLGLAPAAHGANRTGRVFTGDGAGASGDFLMSALNRAGYANLATSQRPDDGLRLNDVYIAAAVRCAPPDNKPLPDEIAACADHLAAEVAALPELRVVVALGKIAWDAWLTHLARGGHMIRPRPNFAHGAIVDLHAAGTPGTLSTPDTPGTPGTLSTPGTPGTPGTLIGCFHPSRQNTNTGKVTAAMYDEIFSQVRRLTEGRNDRGARRSPRQGRRTRSA